jgi:hypothetical protein
MTIGIYVRMYIHTYVPTALSRMAQGQNFAFLAHVGECHPDHLWMAFTGFDTSFHLTCSGETSLSVLLSLAGRRGRSLSPRFVFLSPRSFVFAVAATKTL